MKTIYETTYDDGEYPDSLDYERQDDGKNICCISTELFAFTKSELDQLIEDAERRGFAAGREGEFTTDALGADFAYKDYEDWLSKLNRKIVD